MGILWDIIVDVTMGILWESYGNHGRAKQLSTGASYRHTASAQLNQCKTKPVQNQRIRP